MNKSNKLKKALISNTQNFESIFQDADIDVFGSDKEYAIFLNTNSGETKFEAISYITRENNSFKGAFLSQNDCVFVGYAGEYVMQVENFTDFVENQIYEYEYLEEEERGYVY